MSNVKIWAIVGSDGAVMANAVYTDKALAEKLLSNFGEDWTLEEFDISKGTTGDRYKAELYDEVWQKARSLGYSNVTQALGKLEQMMTQAPAGWQARFIETSDRWDAWSPCTKEHYDLVKRTPAEWPGYEVRPIFTAPPMAKVTEHLEWIQRIYSNPDNKFIEFRAQLLHRVSESLAIIQHAAGPKPKAGEQ